MPYDPAQGPSLQLWVEDSLMYKDSPATTLCSLDGEPVREWHDHSAHDNHLVTYGLDPVYRASSINGRHCARGNGSNHGLANATLFQGWTDFTVFIVFQATASQVNFERLIDVGYGTDLSICRNGLSANRWGCFVAGQFGSHFPTITLTDGTRHILCVHRAGSTITVYGDGETNSASDAGCSAAAITASRAGFMSAYNGGLGGSGTLADVGAYIVRNAALSASDRANDWNYLAARYGITLSGVGGGSSRPAHASLFTLAPLTGVH